MGPARFIVPAQPVGAKVPPSGPEWLHEIKHDGFRLLAVRAGDRVRLYTRKGHNWSTRFPLIARAMEVLTVRSCLIDGEVIVCDDSGLADFELLRGGRHDGEAMLCAFDLLELDGRDLRPEPIEDRKAELAKLLTGCRPGLVVNRFFEQPGDEVFKHACARGCEGIVSKRRGSRYAAGRTDQWRKVKNPAAPAVRREAEIDWGRRRAR
jgi:bifunctional non-homologous end joining protein LigD